MTYGRLQGFGKLADEVEVKAQEIRYCYRREAELRENVESNTALKIRYIKEALSARST